ncbi:hypothetical protein DPX16_17755 [Anabarilius grahami]|uniref:Uncharacterized protein n=1 Tax=Anabarilius grahami TaxID=495550 RepID=A0A3N0YHB5_ANAGA|nr:hypothetical protein DPX16_17755 [Anabarilius grahami]
MIEQGKAQREANLYKHKLKVTNWRENCKEHILHTHICIQGIVFSGDCSWNDNPPARSKTEFEDEVGLWKCATIDLMSDEEDGIVGGVSGWIVRPPSFRSQELTERHAAVEIRGDSKVQGNAPQTSAKWTEFRQNAASYLQLRSGKQTFHGAVGFWASPGFATDQLAALQQFGQLASLLATVYSARRSQVAHCSLAAAASSSRRLEQPAALSPLFQLATQIFALADRVFIRTQLRPSRPTVFFLPGACEEKTAGRRISALG